MITAAARAYLFLTTHFSQVSSFSNESKYWEELLEEKTKHIQIPQGLPYDAKPASQARTAIESELNAIIALGAPQERLCHWRN